METFWVKYEATRHEALFRFDKSVTLKSLDFHVEAESVQDACEKASELVSVITKESGHCFHVSIVTKL